MSQSETPKFTEDQVKNLYADVHSYILGRWAPRPGYEPPIIVKEKGLDFWDARGKKWLDFQSQLFNVNIGMHNEKVIEACKTQLDELVYASPTYPTLPKIKLCKKLAQIAPGDLCKTFLSNSGTEAIETALKLAILYKQRKKIIGLWRAYHGSTFGAMSIGGSQWVRSPILPLIAEFDHIAPPYCYRCPFGLDYPSCGIQCAKNLKYVIEQEAANSVAAFLAEPIMSGGGLLVPPDEYWTMIRKICDEKDIVLINDEVMTGFARTGKMFAPEHWNYAPDIDVLAKGITSGYIPLGATMVNKRIADHFEDKPFGHSFTYSGHAVACAAALATIDQYYELKLIDNCVKMGKYIMDGLKGIQERTSIVGDVRGKGLFLGIEMVKHRETKETLAPMGQVKPDPEIHPMVYLLDRCSDEGLAFGMTMGGSIVRMTPALIVIEEQIDEALKIFEKAINATEEKFNLPKKE